MAIAEQTKEKESFSLAVEGMTCAACVWRIEEAVSRVPGVHEAAVNLATERALVSYDPAEVTPAAIAHAVTEAGLYSCCRQAYAARARHAGRLGGKPR